jgi:Ca2+-binding RTX toxin-like protein
MVVLVILPSIARAAIGDCGAGDAPPGFDDRTSCGSVCEAVGGQLTCELEKLCSADGASAWVVTGYGDSPHDVTAWGECTGGATFCCVFDEEDTAVDAIELSGTPLRDELAFVLDRGLPTERNLESWDGDPLDGYIRAHAGPDLVDGSNRAAPTYTDHLFGNHGPDRIHAWDGADFVSGGDHDDWLYGGDGDDTVWGGDGDDHAYGQNHDDALCDSSGYDACASDGGNWFSGGNGHDELWFDQGEDPYLACPDVSLDPTSAAGAGDDDCGDYADFDETQLPQGCEATVSRTPDRCEGAF